MVSGLTFRTLIHCKCISAYGVIGCNGLILLHVSCLVFDPFKLIKLNKMLMPYRLLLTCFNA